MKLTEDKIRELGFECIRKRVKDKDIDGLWLMDSVTLHQDFWDGSFMFATRLNGMGEYKGGYEIPTIEKLEQLFEGITGKKLKPKTPNPTSQVVQEASKIASKDVRAPKVVRDGLVKLNSENTNPLNRLEIILTTDSRDWSLNRNDAWIYGIICGWENDSPMDGETEDDAVNGICIKHGFDKDELKTLRKNYLNLKTRMCD